MAQSVVSSCSIERKVNELPTAGALQVHVHEVLRVVHAGNNGQLPVDLTARWTAKTRHKSHWLAGQQIFDLTGVTVLLGELVDGLVDDGVLLAGQGGN